MEITTGYLANPYLKERFLTSLYRIFGEFDTTLLTMLEPLLEWVEIGGGDVLFQQNDPGDSLYFVISGRLQAFVTDQLGHHQVIGEIVRGETVGELAIFTGDTRSATIIALRDSVLVKLPKEAFKQVIDAYPAVSMNVTKLIISRFRAMQEGKQSPKKPVNICLLAIHNSLDTNGFVDNLLPALRRKGAVYVASSISIDAQYNTPGISQTNKSNPDAHRELTQWLDDQEVKHEFVLYVTDPLTPDDMLTEWTLRCLRQADQILLLADTQQGPGRTSVERECFSGLFRLEAAQTLVLMHPSDTATPRQTDQWLAQRPGLRAHYHLRTGLPCDMDRLARVLSGTAIGLVLAGGGAKGFAHIGVLKALREWHIPVDVVGGTSVGGIIAGVVSFDQPIDLVVKFGRKAAFYNPTKDYNLLPFISLIRGRRIEQMIQTVIQDFTGHTDLNIEDSWLTFFTLSSNYTQAREELHTRGSLAKYLRATTAIPGVFPPVIDGDDLLMDGGTFNNFPVDVMSRFGVGKVIGVDLNIDKHHKLSIEQMPSPAALLRDRFRPKSRKKYRLPSLVSIMLNAPLLYSNARRTEAIRHTDLYFNPDVSRFAILSWTAFDQIVAKGYEHAVEVLKQMSEEELAVFRT